MLHRCGECSGFHKKERGQPKIGRQYDAEKAGADRKNFPQIKERFQKNGFLILKAEASERLRKNF